MEKGWNDVGKGEKTKAKRRRRKKKSKRLGDVRVNRSSNVRESACTCTLAKGWYTGPWMLAQGVASSCHARTYTRLPVSVGREHALAPACIRVFSKSYPSSEIWIFQLVEHTEQNVTLRYARWEGVASECKPQYRPAASTRRVLLIWTTYLRSASVFLLLAFPPCRRIVNVAHPPFTRSCCSPCVQQRFSSSLNNRSCRRVFTTRFPSCFSFHLEWNIYL